MSTSEDYSEKIKMEKQNNYNWRKCDTSKEFFEWSLRLFPNGENAVYYPTILRNVGRLLTGKTKVILPFIGRQKNQNTAPHLIRLKVFEPGLVHPSDIHYYGNKPNYAGEIDAEFYLIYEDWLDWEYRTEAFFLDGEFKCGRMPTKGGRYTENLREFKEDLTNYFEPTQRFGLPNFGDYIREFFRNSNLSLETIFSFKELAE